MLYICISSNKLDLNQAIRVSHRIVEFPHIAKAMEQHVVDSNAGKQLA